MPQIQGIGTTWNLPNYAGELFTADPSQTPLLSMIGGLSGGKQTDNCEFATSVLYDYPDPEQPSVSENASVTAPQPAQIAKTQQTNVVQIFQESINLTYAKQSNAGRMSGLNTAGQTSDFIDEKAWQIQHKLIKIARDVEHTFISGSYQKSTDADTPNKTRGMLELCKNGTTIDAAGGALTKSMLVKLYREMADNGAYFSNMVMFLSSLQKQAITEIYASQFGMVMPNSRNIGGINLTEIETDFFKLGIVWSRFMPKSDLLIADISHVAPVFQAVPGKGVLFEEELAKKGASDSVQIYGQIGLAHGPEFLHGSITGLKTT